MTTVVVVESPAKARTIHQFLGSDYQVVASYGHVRDLPSKTGSVDPEAGFAMAYEIPKTSTRHVEALAKAARTADTILLATDPDREGEAISWHVLEILRAKKLLQGKEVRRVVFHEITRRAIQEALDHARDLDMNMVNAQQARRALDYLVGFNLSPLLWKKVLPGLSAGRVQSVALRLVCERHDEILRFQPREYWSIRVDARASAKGRFSGKLEVAEGKKLDKFDIPNEAEAQRLTAAVSGQPLYVAGVEKKQTQRKPSPPFTTSTLQQEAYRKLSFSAKKTMMLAQRLYEGQEVVNADGHREEMGLITYMRTDSVNLANEAIDQMRSLIQSRFGPTFLPKSPIRYKSTAKNAQEAHEAIRPTHPELTPESLKGVLDRDLGRLYELIWKRSIACQMAPAKVDQVGVTLSVGAVDKAAPFRFRATGSTIAFPGFLQVYSEGRDEVSSQDREEADQALPPLAEGDAVTVEGIIPNQHFTEPPPRYTEASLVKTLESYGIGRPSTYAPIMSTLQDRGYARLESGKFYPEDVGVVVNQFLVEHFSHYVDYHFTAQLEDELDAISRGEKVWTPVLDKFWGPFIERVKGKERDIRRADVTSEATDKVCPECEKPLLIRLGRYGRFFACTGYPECRFTEKLPREGGSAEQPVKVEPVESGENCPLCSKPLWVKDGRFGKYLSCSGYPACRHRQPLSKPAETGVQCPLCKKGTFLEKKSRRGKVFYSCSGYPKCKNALWNKPVARTCPQCGAAFLTEKETKARGVEHLCVTEGCGFKEAVSKAE